MAKFSPVEHVQLLGDKSVAASWLPFARRKFRALDNGESKSFYKHLRMSDAAITLRRTGKVRTIQIDGMGGGLIVMYPEVINTGGALDGRSYGSGGTGDIDGDNQMLSIQPTGKNLGKKHRGFPSDSDDIVAFSHWTNPATLRAVSWSSIAIYHKKKKYPVLASHGDNPIAAWYAFGTIIYASRQGRIRALSSSGAVTIATVTAFAGTVFPHISPGGTKCFLIAPQDESITEITIYSSTSASATKTDNTLAVPPTYAGETALESGSYASDHTITANFSLTITASKTIGVVFNADDTFRLIIYEIVATHSMDYQLVRTELPSDPGVYDSDATHTTTITEVHTVTGAEDAPIVVLDYTYTFVGSGGRLIHEGVSWTPYLGPLSAPDTRVQTTTRTRAASGAGLLMFVPSAEYSTAENYNASSSYELVDTTEYFVASPANNSRAVTETSESSGAGIRVQFCGAEVYASPGWATNDADEDSAFYLRTASGIQSSVTVIGGTYHTYYLSIDDASVMDTSEARSVQRMISFGSTRMVARSEGYRTNDGFDEQAITKAYTRHGGVTGLAGVIAETQYQEGFFQSEFSAI